MAKITTLQLGDKLACKEQIERFEDLFGEEVEVTLELCIKHATDFDWWWAAAHLLSSEQMALWSIKRREVYIKNKNENYMGERYFQELAAAWFECWQKDHPE